MRSAAEGLGDVSGKKMKNIEKTAKDYGAKGLAYIQLKSDGSMKCPFAKFLSEEELQKLIEAVGAKQGDLVVFAADKFKVVCDVLGALRLKFAEELNLLDKSEYKFVWITEFPLLEWSEEQGRIYGDAPSVYHADGRRPGVYRHRAGESARKGV